MIWLEIVVGFAVPIGWGLWELYALRRDRLRDRSGTAGPAKAPDEAPRREDLT